MESLKWFGEKIIINDDSIHWIHRKEIDEVLIDINLVGHVSITWVIEE